MTQPDTRTALTRRRLLGVLGAGAATAVPVVSFIGRDGAAGASTPATSSVSATDASCGTSDTAEQEVGPFYVADGLVRSDITSGEDGVPLTFTITLTTPGTCEPLVGAAVDVWHASALGVYSDESSEQTVGETFLRGVQLTDEAGTVTFTSVYPGWYSGRTNHIHLRVYTGGTVSGTSYDYTDATLVHTGQLFFDPDINTEVAAVAPYSSNTVTRTTNAQDRVYTQQSGAAVLATTTGSTTAGYTSEVSYVVTGASSVEADSTGLSMTASRSSVVYGNETTLSGTLEDTTSSRGLSGQKIVIASTSASGTKRTTVTTGTGGAWSRTFRPAVSASYRASYAATASSAAAVSSSRTITVHRRITVGHVSPTAEASRPVVMRGQVAPAAAELPVTLHRIVDGTARTLTHVRTDSGGRWSVRLRLGKGTHRLYARVAATGPLAEGTSRTVTVHRT